MISFYGGKQGFSINLVKEYKTKNDMENNYKTDLNIGEYCIISDSHNLNNAHHGELYMRDFDKLVYKGNISGPVGTAVRPQVFISINESMAINQMIEKINNTTLANDVTSVVCGYADTASPKYYFFKVTDSSDNTSKWIYAGPLGNQMIASTTEPNHLLPGDIWLKIEEV